MQNAFIRSLKKIKRIPAKIKSLSGKKLAPETPGQSLLIETVAACNAKCTFCPMQSEGKVGSGRMSLKNFQELIANNAEFIRKTYSGVEPYYRGEPLLHTNFWNICETLESHGIRNNGINSNMSIKNVRLDVFKEFEVPLIVNLGGVTKNTHEGVMRETDFDIVIQNIKRLIKLDVNFHVKINPTKKNLHELPSLPGFIESLGGRKDQVLIYSTCYPIPATASHEEKKRFFDENISPELEPHLRFTYDLSKPDFDIRAKQPGCNFLVDTIFYDGQMTMCCHDQLQTVNIGNAFETKLEEIRSSAAYQDAINKAKRMEHSMCAECN